MQASMKNDPAMQQRFVSRWYWHALVVLLTFYGWIYGARWDSMANPTRDVTVLFEAGRSEKGDLSTTWDGRRVLTLADGRTLSFSEDAALSMSWQLPKEPRPFWHLWRAWLPAAVVAIVWFAALLMPLRTRNSMRRSQ